MKSESSKQSPDDDAVLRATRRWVEQVVVGLNLCPFAQRELVRGRVRFALTRATSGGALLDALRVELERLDAEPSIATTLLVHPDVLADFRTYNDFLDAADELLVELGYEGVYQVASFHPDYRFAGTGEDDPENYTNRSPWPLLHLLREESVAGAVDGHPDVDGIPERNIARMNALGRDRLRAVLRACSEED